MFANDYRSWELLGLTSFNKQNYIMPKFVSNKIWEKSENYFMMFIYLYLPSDEWITETNCIFLRCLWLEDIFFWPNSISL